MQNIIHSIAILVVTVLLLLLVWCSFFPGFYWLANIILIVFYWFVLFIFLFISGVLGRHNHRYIRKSWRCLLAVSVIFTASTFFQVPMKLSFIFAKPGLDQFVQKYPSLQNYEGNALISAGLYDFSLPISVKRKKMDSTGCNHKKIILFINSESAFIYSTNGIKDLCYWSGSKGHLLENWYWMAED